MPGMVVVRHNQLIQGMALKAIIAAAMHKLVHLIYGVLKTRQPCDVNWAKATVEIAVLITQAPTNRCLALNFQGGI